MKPFGFALGALTGAAAVLLLRRPGAQRARPIAKAALKAAMMAYHEARAGRGTGRGGGRSFRRGEGRSGRRYFRRRHGGRLGSGESNRSQVGGS